MSRYYSVCEVTSSIKQSSKRYLRIYNKAPQGYLFHDTENPLDFSHIRRALFVLAELYDASAKAVVGIRVNPNTIVATFNTSGLPKPARDGGKEYIANKRLTGWLHPNARDPGCDTLEVDYDDIYDQCTMLERFTGHCPCPKLEEGLCLPNTMFAQHPWLAEAIADYTDPEPSEYKRTRYREIDSFTFTPGQYTVGEDFTEAVRPWDNYDFALVPTRKEEFSERGSANARRHVHRKVECSQCIFSTKNRNDTYSDCGQVNRCKQHATEEQAWAVLYKWLEHSTAYTTGNAAFALHEIHYLMRASGMDYLSRAITPTRNIMTKLAGFSGRDSLSYRVVPCQGNTERRATFSSYADLRKVIHGLPASKDIPEVHLDKKHVLAHAIYATWYNIHGSGHQPHPVYSITHERDYVCLTGTTSRSTFSAGSLSTASHVKEFFSKLWPGSYHTVNDKIGPDYPY